LPVDLRGLFFNEKTTVLMKNSALILGVAGLVAGLGVLSYMEVRRHRKQAATESNMRQIAAAGVPLAQQKFAGFRFTENLNEMTKNAVPEIVALQHMINAYYVQHMINAYYGGTETIAITGIYDTATQSAVKDITRKYSTSLKEFNFQFLIKKRGEIVANDLLTSITITGTQS
jgi:hypothetical protein